MVVSPFVQKTSGLSAKAIDLADSTLSTRRYRAMQKLVYGHLLGIFALNTVLPIPTPGAKADSNVTKSITNKKVAQSEDIVHFMFPYEPPLQARTAKARTAKQTTS